MLRPVAVLGALAALALAGCGDDEEPAAQQVTAPLTAPAQTAPAPASAQTTTSPRRRPAPQPRTTTATTPQPPTTTEPLEKPVEEVRRQSARRVAQARRSGARECPDIGEDGAGVIDITAKGVSCEAARKIITTPDRDAKQGFACEIQSESFADVPTVAFLCRRSDGARIGYTAVG